MSRFQAEGTDFIFQHKAVVALQAIGAASASQGLLDISLGKAGARDDGIREWAARAFVSGISTAEEGKMLLDADVPGVQTVGLQFLAGKGLDEQTAVKVSNLIKSENLGVRWSTAKLMGRSPQAAYANLYVGALSKAASTADRVANADKTYPRSYCTYAEMDMFEYIDALSRMPLNTLEQEFQRASGVSSRALAIALARQGSAAGLPIVRATLQDPDAGAMRIWAARGLGKSGTEADLILLKNIAETDSMVRRDTSSLRSHDGTGEFFPVRQAAKDAIADFTSRSN